MDTKKIIQYVKNAVLYAGVSKEDYHSVSEKIRLTNLHVWLVLSLAEAIIFLVCFITSFYNESVEANKIIYLLMMIGSLLIFLSLLLFRKKIPKVGVDILSYISIGFLMVYGMAVGTLSDQDLPSITFMVMLVIAPMLIVGRPFITTLMVLCFMVTFLIMVNVVKTGASLSLDNYNAVLFAIVSIILHFFTVTSKMKGLVADYKLERLTTYDGLTGLENEFSYVTEVENMNNAIKSGKQENFAVIMCDVNGIKPTNDTYGHQYGCALIVEGGHYLGKLFTTSRLFHVGGDEYIVILKDKDYEERERLLQEFEAKMDDYFIEKEGIRLRVSIAYGLSDYKKNEDKKFASVLQRADKAMYEKKKQMKLKYKIASRKEE